MTAVDIRTNATIAFFPLDIALHPPTTFHWWGSDSNSDSNSDTSDSDEVPECMVNNCDPALVQPFYTMDIDAAQRMGMMDTMVCLFVRPLVEDGCTSACRGTHDEEMMMDVLRACGLMESDPNRYV